MADEGVTVAAKVTFCPTVDVVGVTVSAVVVADGEAAATVSVTEFEVLAEFFESPL